MKVLTKDSVLVLIAALAVMTVSLGNLFVTQDLLVLFYRYKLQCGNLQVNLLGDPEIFLPVLYSMLPCGLSIDALNQVLAVVLFVSLLAITFSFGNRFDALLFLFLFLVLSQHLNLYHLFRQSVAAFMAIASLNYYVRFNNKKLFLGCFVVVLSTHLATALLTALVITTLAAYMHWELILRFVFSLARRPIAVFHIGLILLFLVLLAGLLSAPFVERYAFAFWHNRELFVFNSYVGEMLDELIAACTVGLFFLVVFRVYLLYLLSVIFLGTFFVGAVFSIDAEVIYRLIYYGYFVFPAVFVQQLRKIYKETALGETHLPPFSWIYNRGDD